MQQQFTDAVSVLSESLIRRLERIPQTIQMQATEVRLRTGLPLMIMTTDQTVFLLKNGGIGYENRADCYRVTQDDLQKSFRKICGYSVHSYQNEIKNGFLTIDGNRIGFCGTAAVEEGAVTALRRIYSINLRIARQVNGVADRLAERFRQGDPHGMLIVGAPSTGKTTLLKDLVRQLANGSVGRYYRVSVIDERGEIGGDRESANCPDLGCSVDVFSGYPKGKGMEIALRTMSPDILVCDEIGNQEDLRAMEAAVHSGVAVLATIHAADRSDLIAKPCFSKLLQTGAFTDFVFLDRRIKKCKISEICSVEQLFDFSAKEGADERDEDSRNHPDHTGFFINRGAAVVEFIKEGE